MHTETRLRIKNVRKKLNPCALITENQTEGEVKIYMILLVGLCNLVAPLVLIRLHIYYRLKFQNIFKGFD